MRAILRFLGDIWPSIVATIAAAVGAFLSMGILGLVLYYLVSPALNLTFPPLNAWDQSVVWPLVIGAALVWSPSFLPAGIVDRRLKMAGWTRMRRVLVYLAILWLAALASWWFILSVNSQAWR